MIMVAILNYEQPEAPLKQNVEKLPFAFLFVYLFRFIQPRSLGSTLHPDKGLMCVSILCTYHQIRMVKAQTHYNRLEMIF